MRRTRILEMHSKTLACFIALACIAFIAEDLSQAQMITQEDVAKLPVSAAGIRIKYGPDPMQFGDLRLPRGKGPFPVAVVIHGGCWLASVADLSLNAPLAEALTDSGFATWNIEYRSVDSPGGGWPNTMLDTAKAVDHVRTLAAEYPLDMSRVIVIGHSAGGHLALWTASRGHLDVKSPLYLKDPLRLAGVIGLAAIPDLESYIKESDSCGSPILKLLGGTALEFPERYNEAAPIKMLPTGVPLVLVTGADDTIVDPENSKAFVAAAKRAGDRAKTIVVDNAGHFDVIAPNSHAFKSIKKAALELVK